MSKPEPSDIMLELTSEFYPRRYRRFKDLRPYQDACEWAQKLDWQNNPYDRFLLRRELLRYLESTEFYRGRRNIFSFASRHEIGAELDKLLDAFQKKYESIGVFNYLLVSLSWHLRSKHGLIRYSRLSEALTRFPSKSMDGGPQLS
jgi:hypothetical protein